MLCYCLKVIKNTESLNPKVAKTNKGEQMILSKYVMNDSKKLRFIKKQEASGLLNQLGSKPPLSNILVLDYIFI